jgi:hypothetical protein
MVTDTGRNVRPRNAPLTRAFELVIDGKTYQVQVLRPGVIAVDDNVFNVEITPNGVKVGNELFIASIGTDASQSGRLSIVGGKLYETAWKVQ